MTKRTLAMLLALLALLLTGCGNAEPKTTEAEIGSQSTDDAAALPDTTEQKPVADAPMMVMVDNTLYQSTGEVSTVDGRCGNTVSYTHLDVYKRQVQASAQRVHRRSDR